MLLATDGSDQARLARDLVHAAAWPAGTTVRVVEALGTTPTFAGLTAAMRDELLGAAAEMARPELAEFVKPLARADLTIEQAVLEGRAGTTIVEDARTRGADVIVVGSHGRGALGSLVLGSVSAEVVDRAPCPVLVARRSSLSRVVFAEDGSEGAKRAADAIATWPMFRTASVRVVSVAHVGDYLRSGVAPSQRRAAREAQRQATAALREEHGRLGDSTSKRFADAGLVSSAEVREGDPARQLVEAAHEFDADLIAVGSRGRTVLAQILLGSVARGVLLYSPTSVLVARAAKG